MLRRSISRAIRPMPMKIAMKSPNSDIAASPRSLMILRSCPAVSWPIRYDAAMRRTAKATMLYSTLSRTESLKTCRATRAMVRMPGLRVWFGGHEIRHTDALMHRDENVPQCLGASVCRVRHSTQPALVERATLGLPHLRDEEVLERVPQRIHRHQTASAGRRQRNRRVRRGGRRQHDLVTTVADHRRR